MFQEVTRVASLPVTPSCCCPFPQTLWMADMHRWNKDGLEW